MSERLSDPVMPVEPDNHHNALLCPYCRPGVEERIERIVAARLAAVEALLPTGPRSTVDLYLMGEWDLAQKTRAAVAADPADTTR